MKANPPALAQASTDLPAFGLVLALLAVDGLHFVFARALHAVLPPLTSVLFVLAVATVQVSAFAAIKGKLNWQTFAHRAPFFLAIGALVAVSTTVNYIAIGFVDPGTAALLSQTSVLFGLGFGLLWLRERLTQAQLIGAAVCIAGVAIITFQPGDYFRLGSLMVVGSAFLYALHAAIVKRQGIGLDFVEFFAWRLISTTGFLLISAGLQGALAWPEASAWPLIIAAGTVDVVISRSLYYLSLRRLKISMLTLALTLTPVVTIAWSLVLFGAQPTAQQLIGGAAVLAGVLIVTTRRAA
ncbi:MAG: DMT family transporter [Anaerolineae bacterium]|nr:DMT family transporter [Candidatus Roseilinea sp.]MDW8450208.1 DMT family transporter [Anaerolineae bacterium]